MVVVLPAPFGPRNPYTVPEGTARSTPQTARVSPNDFARPDASIASGERDSKAVLLVECLRPSRVRRPLRAELIATDDLADVTVVTDETGACPTVLATVSMVASADEKVLEIDGHELHISHPDKVFFSER